MALPYKIVDVNTATWSDYKNSFCAVHNAIKEMRNSSSDGSIALGNSVEYAALRFQTGQFGPMLSVYVYADKVGSPTFTVSCELYADNGSGEPDLSNKLASAVSLPASQFPTTARLVLFTFLVQYPILSDTTYHVVFKASAAGDASNHVRLYKKASGSLVGGTGGPPNTGTRAFGSSTWTYPSPQDILRCAVFMEGTHLLAVGVDKTNNKIRAYRSTDGGVTWAEVSSASAPACSTTSGYKNVQVQQSLKTTYDPILAVFVPTATDTFNFYTHDNTTGGTGWGSLGSAATSAINADGSGNVPEFSGRRLNGDSLIAHQGLTETVMGAARRRVKVQRPLDSFGLIDVVGSPNSPISATQPGTATHYDLRLAFMDMEDRFHIFFSASDSNQIQHRVLKADNTFESVNTLGSTAAVCSNTSAYPIGLGCNYFKDEAWRIAIPYLDSTSGTIKVAHCNASESHLAASWTIEQVSADAPEVATSNLGFLTADSQQSAKLVLFYVKSDDTIWMTNDGGTGTWTTPAQWRSGQTVAGVSGFTVASAINLMYLDTAPTPDELKFDRL